MPHSLRVKLSGLKYKGLLTDKDYQRLKNALDVVDGLQDAIAEIENKIIKGQFFDYKDAASQAYGTAVDIIREHTRVE